MTLSVEDERTINALDFLWLQQKKFMTLDGRCHLWNAANHLFNQLSDNGKGYWFSIPN